MMQSVSVRNSHSTLTETIMNRSDLVDAYAQQILDAMDMKTLEQFAYDCLVENLNNYSEDDLITEVSEYYPELLEDTEPVYPTEVTEPA